MKTLFLIHTVVWLDDFWQLYSNDHTGKIYDAKSVLHGNPTKSIQHIKFIRCFEGKSYLSSFLLDTLIVIYQPNTVYGVYISQLTLGLVHCRFITSLFSEYQTIESRIRIVSSYIYVTGNFIIQAFCKMPELFRHFIKWLSVLGILWNG